MAFFMSSGRVGTLLLQLRAVEVKDKVNTKKDQIGNFFGIVSCENKVGLWEAFEWRKEIYQATF